MTQGTHPALANDSGQNSAALKNTTINTGSTKFNTAIEYDTDENRTAYSRVKHYINNGKAYSYEYGEDGNISKITNPDGSWVAYEYDALGQLTKETYSDGRVITNSYDSRGNRIIVNDSVNGSEVFVYSLGAWKDQLIESPLGTHTYDTIGNPTQWGTGVSLTWQRGRQLASYTSTDTTATYTYNADGIRTSKTVNGSTTTYTVVDGTLRRMVDDQSKTLQFVYGNGLTSVIYDGTEYWYVFNAQGDVVGLVDATGAYVVEYTYDAWGKPLMKTGTLATTLGKANPFRYRGYIYDEETGFYYVSSRYYDPAIGRWLNADEEEYLGVDGTPLSYNLFAYCMNNPANRFDVNGNWSLPNWAKVTIGAVAIAGLAVATVCTGGAAAVICGAALSGAIAGGASGAVMGAIGGGISGGWQGAIDGACSGFMSGTLVGGVTGAASAGLNIATGATTVVGNAHGSTLHKLATNMEAGKMVASGQYSQIGVNKALKTMGLNGTKRPDVIGIAKNGANKLVEVVSPKQSTSYIAGKMSNMLSDNPGAIGKIVTWVRRLFT